jgi:hypothetical protein
MSDGDDVTDQYRIIGRLEAQQAATDERVERIETKVDDINGKVGEIRDYISRQKGGMKVVWGIAAAGGVIGVSLNKLGGMLLAALRGAS